MDTLFNLFISHSWSYGDRYEKLMKLLDNDTSFHYTNYSLPKDDPVHSATDTSMLYQAIKEQMSCASVVLILAGVYATYSKWIIREITIAKSEFEIPKKILAIEPWGSEKTSQIVRDNADRTAKWTSNSIIKSIRDLVI